MVIKRVAPLSAARIAGLIYTLLGLPFALLVWIISLVGLNYSGMSNSPFLPFSPAYVVEGGAIAVIILPLVYGFFCFVMTLIGAWLYNLTAGFMGGVTVELEVNMPVDAAVR